MKKLFLTSGVVLCLACPAFADTTDINANGSVTGIESGHECVIGVLGVEEGTTSFESKWNPNISGAITLNSNRFATSDASTAASTATTAAATSPLYSVYDYGVYTSQPTLANYESATKYTQLTTLPAMTGYGFAGFYTGKAGTGTLVINSSGAIQDAAKTAVTATNGTATWYANWTANDYTVTYAAGAHGSGSSTDTATYDSGYTPKTAAAASITAAAGYTFDKWSGNFSSTGTETATDYAAGTQFTYQIPGPLTLTAQYIANQYTISYAAGTAGTHAANYVTGSVSATTGVDFDDSSITLQNYTGSGNDTGFSATGYRFDHWSSTYDLETNEQTATNYNGGATLTQYRHPDNITLTAVWAPNTYTVSYSCGTAAANSGAISGDAPASQAATYDATFVFAGNVGNTTLHNPATPCARVGYQFNGWSCKTNTNDTTVDQTANAANWEVTDDVTCTAVWQANTISITWDPKNGESTTQNYCTYDEGVTLPTQPEKTGYKFNGWHVNNPAPAQQGD